MDDESWISAFNGNNRSKLASRRPAPGLESHIELKDSKVLKELFTSISRLEPTCSSSSEVIPIADVVSTEPEAKVPRA